ncbi:MAG TPA: aspartyl protease family protein, partial [Longimicrobium sp.]|nr:aspartyl protease family protein [Longimicrobium sp.]
MAHFTLSTDPANGPVVHAFVAVSPPRHDALVAAGQPVPTGVAVRALVDTGASCTCLDPSVISTLRLTPTGSVSVHTPSTGAAPHVTEQFDVSV